MAGDDAAANMATGGCGRATTESFIPAHTHAAVVTDLRDHSVLLTKLREWHGACTDVATTTANPATAINLIISLPPLSTSRRNSALDQIGMRSDARCARSPRGCREGHRHQVPRRRVNGATPTFDVASLGSTPLSALIQLNKEGRMSHDGALCRLMTQSGLSRSGGAKN
jgi:hypothetical protein